jgi:hypothetical protein
MPPGEHEVRGEKLVHRTRRLLSLSAVVGLLAVGVTPAAFASEVALADVVDAELPLDDVAAAEGGDDGSRTGALEAPIAFTAVWVELPDGLDAVRLRTSLDGRAWSDWSELEAVDTTLDAPDPGTAEAVAAADGPRVTDLLQLEEARYVQLDADADAGDVVLRFVDAAGLNESLLTRVVRHLTPRPAPAQASTVPSWVEPRSAWGAAAYRGTPSVARNGVQQVVLHHTAGQNDLVRSDGTCDRSRIIATLRGIQRWHQDGNGWSDVGYNVMIDPCGGVWEGRQGGLDRAVIGAHAAGANTGSTGVSVLGNYTSLTPNARILDALDRVVGWKAGIHGIDATGSVTRTINGTTRTYPTVVGHQQVGSTACPGTIMNSIGRVRTNAAVAAPSYPRVPDGLGVARFSDITGNTHAAAIETLVDRGITGGFADGTFRPLVPITRAQVATFLARALELDPVPGARFSDVPAGYTHEGTINALVERGVLGGYADGSFRPLEPLRREHMAVILARALELEPQPEVATRFSDVVAYAAEIEAIAVAGVTSGFPDGTFQPRSAVNRGQMATFLVNALKVLDAAG